MTDLENELLERIIDRIDWYRECHGERPAGIVISYDFYRELTRRIPKHCIPMQQERILGYPYRIDYKMDTDFEVVGRENFELTTKKVCDLEPGDRIHPFAVGTEVPDGFEASTEYHRGKSTFTWKV